MCADKPLIVDRDSIEKLLLNVFRTYQGAQGDVDSRPFTYVVDAFKQACWDYDAHQQTFVRYAFAWRP